MTVGTKRVMSDVEVDKAIKIQGTQYDRKRKLTDRQVRFAKKLLDAGHSVKYVADTLGVSRTCIKYNTDAEWRKNHLGKLSGAHSGVQTMLFADRVTYKRSLVAATR